MSVFTFLVVLLAITSRINGFSLNHDKLHSNILGNNDIQFGVSQQPNRRDFTSIIATTALGFVSPFLTSQPTLAEGQSLSSSTQVGGRIVFGDESIMSQKEHGTSSSPVQPDLLYGVSNKLADQICNYNRHFAERGGYFQYTSFAETVLKNSPNPVTFYDSVTGKPLFVAPIGRTAEEFLKESEVHGWPSFRDSEVMWNNVRVLNRSGETVSVDGTHLGHNLPDRKGNRYCINLVSIAGHPINT